MLEPDTIYNKISDLGKERVIENLHNIYPKSSKKDRIRILEILNRIDDTTHFEIIENYFISDENPEVRIEAAKLLAFNYDKKRAIKPLIWMLEREREYEIKTQLIHLLAALSYKKDFRQIIVKTLSNLLEEDNVKIKLDAIESLILIKEPSMTDKLIKLLNSEHKLVRLRAIRALGSLRVQKVVPFLLENFKQEGLDEWRITFEALQKILGKYLPTILLEKFKRSESQKELKETAKLRYGIAKAMGELKDKKFVKPLQKMEKDKHFYWVREMATEALRKIK